MKRAFALFCTMPLLAVAGGASTPSGDGPTPEEATIKIKTGNARYTTGQSKFPRQDAKRRAETFSGGQHPFATVITCSDSRVPVEILFDQGIGDLFVIRVAGNVCDTDEVASIEYGVDHLGTPLLVVLGHRDCGAVTAVVTGAEVHGSIPALLDRIVPAVVKTKLAHPDADQDEMVALAVENNVWQGIEDLLMTSSATRARVADGRLRILGALYDIEAGEVKWLGRHAKEAEILRALGPEPKAGAYDASEAKQEHATPAAPEATEHAPKHGAAQEAHEEKAEAPDEHGGGHH